MAALVKSQDRGGGAPVRLLVLSLGDIARRAPSPSVAQPCPLSASACARLLPPSRARSGPEADQ